MVRRSISTTKTITIMAERPMLLLLHVPYLFYLFLLLLTLPTKVSADAFADGLLDPATQDLFTTKLPNPLDESYKYKLDGHLGEQWAKVAACSGNNHETGITDSSGNNLKTSIYGYYQDEDGGDDDNNCLWPGKTFEATSYQKLFVKWENKIDTSDGYILTGTVKL